MQSKLLRHGCHCCSCCCWCWWWYLSLLLAWHWQTVSNSMTLYLRLELHLPQMPWISSIRTVGPAAVAVAAAEAAAAAPASSSAFSLLLVCASLLVYRLLPETITHLPTQLVCQPARLAVRLTVRLSVRLPACHSVLPSCRQSQSAWLYYIAGNGCRVLMQSTVDSLQLFLANLLRYNIS